MKREQVEVEDRQPVHFGKYQVLAVESEVKIE